MSRSRVLLSGSLLTSITLLSELLCALRLYRAAAAAVRFGIRVSHDFKSEFRVELAVIHERMGRLDEAIAQLTDLAQREPDNAGCRLELGVMHESKGQYDLAAANLQRLLDLSSDAAPEFRASLKLKIEELRRNQ